MGWGGEAKSGIARAKEAMVLFLHSLPTGSLFNIWSFGSSHSSLFPTSQPYEDDMLAKAKAHVESMEADMGGTEIYQPLEAIFKGKKSRSSQHMKQIFVLTDGQVSNTDQVKALVARNCKTARLFSMGIGASASR